MSCGILLDYELIYDKFLITWSLDMVRLWFDCNILA